MDPLHCCNNVEDRAHETQNNTSSPPSFYVKNNSSVWIIDWDMDWDFGEILRDWFGLEDKVMGWRNLRWSSGFCLGKYNRDWKVINIAEIEKEKILTIQGTASNSKT